MGGLRPWYAQLPVLESGSLFGLRATEEIRGRGPNPWDLAMNLRNTSLTMRAGNGMSGGTYGGGGPTDPVGMGLETATHLESTSFHSRLQELGIPHVWEDYGPGTHSYPYWNPVPFSRCGPPKRSAGAGTTRGTLP